MKLDAQDIEELRPVIVAVVEQVLRELADSPLCTQQIGFTEAQAARLIGLPKHQLRDARLRGDIRAVRHKGMKQYLYSRRELIRFVEGKSTGAGNEEQCTRRKPKTTTT